MSLDCWGSDDGGCGCAAYFLIDREGWEQLSGLQMLDCLPWADSTAGAALR
jgi:hypothetical protein